ncbi:MAG: MBL fold metallo-hydrolase [Acidiferrobacterales bacterium]
MTEIPLQLLGQSGCRIENGSSVIYMDPYLSNSVQELDSPDLERLIPIPVKPEEIIDADWILVTHDHIDHCDPHTLPTIANVSPGCRFVGPTPVLDKLLEWGIPAQRCQAASENWSEIDHTTRIKAVPAAHPDIKRDEKGNLLTVGYVMEIDGKRIYLAGDTSITEQLIDSLMSLRPITTALLPVNEHNFYRGRRGIIGNMSVRDAFLLADEIGIETVIPVHWDMFAVNSVSPDEIRAIYQQIKPSFDLQMQPTSIVL